MIFALYSGKMKGGKEWVNIWFSKMEFFDRTNFFLDATQNISDRSRINIPFFKPHKRYISYLVLYKSFVMQVIRLWNTTSWIKEKKNSFAQNVSYKSLIKKHSQFYRLQWTYVLFQQIPQQYQDFLNYSRKISFEEDPDYAYMQVIILTIQWPAWHFDRHFPHIIQGLCHQYHQYIYHTY